MSQDQGGKLHQHLQCKDNSLKSKQTGSNWEQSRGHNVLPEGQANRLTLPQHHRHGKRTSAKMSDFDSFYFKSNDEKSNSENNKEAPQQDLLTKKSVGVPCEYSSRILNILRESLEKDPDALLLQMDTIDQFRKQTADTVRKMFGNNP